MSAPAAGHSQRARSGGSDAAAEPESEDALMVMRRILRKPVTVPLRWPPSASDRMVRHFSASTPLAGDLATVLFAIRAWCGALLAGEGAVEMGETGIAAGGGDGGNGVVAQAQAAAGVVQA